MKNELTRATTTTRKVYAVREAALYRESRVNHRTKTIAVPSTPIQKIAPARASVQWIAETGSATEAHAIRKAEPPASCQTLALSSWSPLKRRLKRTLSRAKAKPATMRRVIATKSPVGLVVPTRATRATPANPRRAAPAFRGVGRSPRMGRDSTRVQMGKV